MSKRKKLRTIIMIFVTVAVIFAMFFDPVFKSFLDYLMNVNTVGTYIYSIILNGISLLSFFAGYGVTRKLIIRKKILEEF